MLRELTPDIIPDIPVDHLCAITGAVEGQIRKFQAYCKIWNVRLGAKKEERAEAPQVVFTPSIQLFVSVIFIVGLLE